MVRVEKDSKKEQRTRIMKCYSCGEEQDRFECKYCEQWENWREEE